MSRVYFIALLSVVIHGCQNQTRFDVEVPEVTSADQVGTVRVAVLSRAPWAEYKESLQPNFKLSEKEALELVAADTRYLEEQSIDAANAVLKLALPADQKTKLVSKIIENEATTNTSTTTENRSSGDLSDVLDHSAPDIVSDNTEKPQVGTLASSNLGKVNARLRYQEAAALYQEIQLLNRYIKDVAVREGYVPYVVRFQVTTMPKMRNLPYDSYVNLGFYNNIEMRTSLPKGDAEDKLNKLPLVIPLFATDSMENSIASADVGKIREIGASIGMLGNAAISAGYGNLSKHLDAALGRDTNSLFTIGRLSDNVIRVRMGAMQQVRTNFAMVPKTETITLLVMIDEKLAKEDANKRTLYVHSYSDFIHVTNGTRLKDVPAEIENISIDQFFETHSINEFNTIDNYNELWDNVLQGDWKRFVLKLNSWCSNLKEEGVRSEEQINLVCNADSNFITAEQAWFDISYYQQDNKDDALRIELPKYVEPELFSEQTALLIDDVKNSFSKIKLHGGINLDSNQLCASLFFFKEKVKVDKKNITDILTTKKLTTMNNGRDAIFEFSSLAEWQMDKLVKDNYVELRVARIKPHESCSSVLPNNKDCQSTQFCSVAVKYQKVIKSHAPSPGYSISPVTGFLVAEKDSAGIIRLNISPNKKNPAMKVSITVLNATLSEVEYAGAILAQNGNSFDIDLSDKKKKSIDLKLKGLAVGESVTISSKDDNKGVFKLAPLKVRSNNK